MQYENYEQNKKELIIALKGEIKQDFASKSKSVKSLKQLNFLLSKKDTKAKTLRKELNEYAETHELTELVNLVSSKQDIPEKHLSIINAKLKQITEFKDKLVEGVEDSEILKKVLEYYKNIIERYNNGEEKDLKWNKPWLNNCIYGIPENIHGKQYQGVNITMLALTQDELNLSVPVFITATDLKKLGADPDTLIPIAPVAYKTKGYKRNGAPESEGLIYEKEYNELSKDAQENYREIPLVVRTHVYHPDQLKDNYPEIFQKIASENKWYIKHAEITNDQLKAKQFYDERAEEAIEELKQYCQHQGIDVISNTKCAYNSGIDIIKMVDKDKFFSNTGYAGVFAHECTHSTGHSSRNNRKLANQFGSANYGYEEVVAETGSSQFLLKHNLPSALDKESAAYIIGWMSKLNGTEANKLRLFEAATKQGAEGTAFINDCIAEVKLELSLTEQKPGIANFVKAKIEEQKPKRKTKTSYQPS